MVKDIRIVVVQAKVPNSRRNGEEQARRIIKEVIKQPVDIIGLPEGCISPSPEELFRGYSPLNFIANLAKENNIYIFGADLAVNKEGKLTKRGFLFNKAGNLVGSYDKVVLTPPEKKVGIIPGETLNVFETEFGRMSILVCKDSFHRFSPWFFYELWRKGVEVVFIPSLSLAVNPNFNLNIDQWVCPLRSIAKWFEIYIAAPGTIGPGWDGFKSFGHALILGPRMEVLAEGSANKEEILRATLNSRYLNETRSSLVVWQPEGVPEFEVRISKVAKDLQQRHEDKRG